MTPPIAVLRPSLPVVLALAAVCLALAVFNNDADPDLWHRFALGDWILSNGELPTKDPFSYMPTRPAWVDHEWGCGVLFLAIHRALGDAGLLLLKVALFFGTAYGCARLMQPAPRRLLGVPMLYLLVTVLALAPGFSSTLRCHAFTFLFFTWWLVWLESMRRGGPVPWWQLGITMLLWANLHGGFLAGPALLAAYTAGEMLNRKPVGKYIGLLLMVCLLTMASPYGLANVTTAVRALTHGRAFMPEWSGIGMENAAGFPAFLALAALTILVALTLARRSSVARTDWTATLLVVAALFIAFRHVRHTILFAPIASAFVHPRLAALARACRRSAPFAARLPLVRRLATVMILTLLALTLGAGAVRVATQGIAIGVPESEFAPSAIDFIKRNDLKGRLLVPFNWGSYALWTLWPQNQVSFDGRYDLIYPPEVIAELAAFEFGKGADPAALLKKYPPDIILVRTGSWPNRYLTNSPTWRLVYRDKDACVFLPANKRRNSWLPPTDGPYRVHSSR